MRVHDLARLTQRCSTTWPEMRAVLRYMRPPARPRVCGAALGPPPEKSSPPDLSTNVIAAEGITRYCKTTRRVFPDLNFTDTYSKVAIITGGAQGIGLGT